MASATRLKWALILALLLTGSVNAEERRTYPQQGIQTFRGLDDNSAPTQVEDGRAQDIRNVILDSSLSIQKRYGTSLIGSNILDIQDQDFCAVTGIYYTKFSSATERIIATCGSRFYYLNGSTWTQVTGATITAGQDNQLVFTTALDNIIGTNDDDTPIQYNGTTLANVSFSGLSNAIQKAKTVAFFKNYLIFANTQEGGTRYSTRFRWSNVGTINTWTDADYVDIGALGGQEINAVAELYDNLYVFLTDSIYKISLVGGSDTFQVSKVTDDIGCIAKNSVQSITLSNAQNGLIFLDKDKRIYFFNGVIAQDIGGLIDTTLSGLSGTRLQYAVSSDEGSDYLLCVTNGTASANNLCLDFQYEIGEWTKHTNIPANAMAHVLDANATEQIYFGNYYSMVYQFADTDNRDDVGTATGTVTSVNTQATATASGLQVLYVSGASYTTGALTGAPIELIGGTGATQTNTLAYNTTTGLVVVSAFATTPSTDTTFEVGAIDSYYTTKWYDMGNAATLKHLKDVYFWADADVSSTHTLAYATDYSTDIETLSVALTSASSDSIWGSAIWGTSLWGDVDIIFRQNPIKGSGRYVRWKWSEDDPQETFHIFGYVPVFTDGEVD